MDSNDLEKIMNKIHIIVGDMWWMPNVDNYVRMDINISPRSGLLELDFCGLMYQAHQALGGGE